MYGISKGIPSTVTERISTEEGITSSVSDSGLCAVVLSYSGNPELTLSEELESGKT